MTDPGAFVSNCAPDSGELPPGLRVTLATGPGQHGSELVRSLADAGILERVISSWPQFETRVPSAPGGELSLERRIQWFGLFERTIWGLWRRLPFAGRSEHPRLWIDAVSDRIASGLLGRPHIFHGWSQKSLRSMRVARRSGAKVILEHPMLHVNVWRQLIPEECRTFDIRPSACYSCVSSAMARRMQSEYEESDFIILPSTAAVRSFVEAGEPEAKLLCALPGVDTRLFTPASGSVLEERLFRVLFAGRLELVKGVPYLLSAWNLARLPASELWLVGTMLPEMRPILSRSSPPSVRVLPCVPRSGLAAIYRSADVLVLPSVNEGFGLVLLEAMACGLPVIATVNSGAPDCVVEGRNGFVVPIRDPESIAARLRWLHEHRQECRMMGREARRRVEDQFTSAHYTARLMSCYRQVAAQAVLPLPESRQQ